MAKFCSECGHPMDDNMRFCENCGAPCAATPAQPAPQPPAQPEVPYAQPEAPYTQPEAPYTQPAPQPVPQPQQTPPYPYAAPINAGRQAGYASAPNIPGEEDKKSHLGIGIAIAVIAVLLIAAVIVVFFVWKPFDKKDDNGGSPTPAATTSGETLPGGDIATEAEPTQPAPTSEPTDAPASTDAPALTDEITAGDRLQIERALNDILQAGYSRDKADIDRYLELTFEYNYSDSDTRRALYDSIQEDFYNDIDLFKETYGDDYTLAATVSDTQALSGDEFDDELDYYSEDCDVSSVEMIATVKGSVIITGSVKSETRELEWVFVKADGKWYPAV